MVWNQGDLTQQAWDLFWEQADSGHIVCNNTIIEVEKARESLLLALPCQPNLNCNTPAWNQASAHPPQNDSAAFPELQEQLNKV